VSGEISLPEGKEGMREEDACSDPYLSNIPNGTYWSPADGPCWVSTSRKRTQKRLTKEERRQEQERRKQHHTRAGMAGSY
jgi:hypothetical protein